MLHDVGTFGNKDPKTRRSKHFSIQGWRRLGSQSNGRMPALSGWGALMINQGELNEDFLPGFFLASSHLQRKGCFPLAGIRRVPLECRFVTCFREEGYDAEALFLLLCFAQTLRLQPHGLWCPKCSWIWVNSLTPTFQPPTIVLLFS